MKPFGAWSWLFSIKSFISLLLTLYIAFSLDLERPYWAALTVYVLAQPLSGAVRSKAVYRFLGTVLGAAFCLVAVPNLVDAPELLSLALAAWIGLCLYISLLDRSPRSYVFMLAGYSVSFIALPSIGDPGSIFPSVVARIEEIGLAIVCTTAVDSVIFPMSIGPMLTGWVDRCVHGARTWSAAAFDGTSFSRAPFAADLGQIVRLANYLAHDPSDLRRAVRQLEDLHVRLLLFLPALSSIEDRVRELERQPGGVPLPVRRLLEEMAAWCRAERPDMEFPSRAGRTIQALTPRLTGESDWTSIVVATLLLRLREVIELLQDCQSLRVYLSGGAKGPAPRLVHAVSRAARVAHVDHGMAVWSGLATALIIYLCCLAWIVLAWKEGAIAVQMAAVACCFFSAFDDPVRFIRGFSYQQFPGFLTGIVYLYAILPMISGFEMLALVLAPTYLLSGLLMASPALAGWGLATAEATTMSISYQEVYGSDLVTTIGNDIATVIGIAGAAVVTGMLRMVGAAWNARRLVRANQSELIALAGQRSLESDAAAVQRNRLIAIMMDRLVLLVPRMAAGHDAEQAAEMELSRLRISLNVVEVQHLRRQVSPPVADMAACLLDEIGSYIGLQMKRGDPPPFSLRDRIDRMIRAVAAEPEGPKGSAMILALVGIRRGLFPSAAPYRSPQPGETCLFEEAREMQGAS